METTLLLEDTDFLPEFTPEATRCRSCEGTGMVQCDACFLVDAACDACGEPAEVLADDRLPLCLACKAADEGCACEGTGAVARDGGFDACPAGCEGSVR